MKKNLAVDVPRDAETEIQRVRGLRASIFTRTRIALLCFVMVVTLSVVGGTLAFEKYSGNATPNRGTEGDVDVHIVENVNNTIDTTDTNQTEVTFGTDTKKVKLKAGTDPDVANQKVRVSFVPQRVAATYEASNRIANAFLDEDWSATPATDDDGPYVQYGEFKLYIDANWAEKWDYNNGTFTYKQSLNSGEETSYLLLGVKLTSGEETAEGVKVNVIAEAIQDTAIVGEGDDAKLAW
jgi:hypothetical protein